MKGWFEREDGKEGFGTCVKGCCESDGRWMMEPRTDRVDSRPTKNEIKETKQVSSRLDHEAKKRWLHKTHAQPKVPSRV